MDVVPGSVTLHPDGFEVEIRGRRAEERALAFVVTTLLLAGFSALVFSGPTASLQRLLGLAVWVLVGMIGLFGVQIAYVALAPVRRTAVALSGFTLRLGERRVAVGDIQTIAVRGATLVVDADERHVVPASHTTSSVVPWVRDRVRERMVRWRERDGHAPPEIEALRQ